MFRGSPENGGGTWIHPKLAIRFGIWLSDEFGYLVEEWVEQWLTKGQSLINNESLTAAITQALTPINQRLTQIEQHLSALPKALNSRPWRLPVSTPLAEVPSDYVQLEDGSWLSPEGYQSILRQSRRSLPWDIKNLRDLD